MHGKEFSWLGTPKMRYTGQCTQCTVFFSKRRKNSSLCAQHPVHWRYTSRQWVLYRWEWHALANACGICGRLQLSFTSPFASCNNLRRSSLIRALLYCDCRHKPTNLILANVIFHQKFAERPLNSVFSWIAAPGICKPHQRSSWLWQSMTHPWLHEEIVATTEGTEY
jgi:hypothetical protein